MKYEDDELYHVYNRGSRQGKIFFRAENYRYLIELVFQNSSVYGVRVVAFCFLPNHYHFVLRQLEKGSISSFLRTLFNAYAQAVNLEQRLSGSLFQGKAQSRHIESDEYALQLIRYIHLNPVEARLVVNPENWEFSDYNAWCGIHVSTITDLSLRDAYFRNEEEYKRFV